MRRSPAAFMKLWAIVLGTALACVAGFNWVMDPYRYFGVRIPGVNETKPRPNVDLTNVKRATFTRVSSTALILGNSRADIAFDPEHPAWAHHGLQAFNLGVPGAGIEATLGNFRWVLARQPIRRVLIGVDFADFLGTGAWAESGAPPAGLALSERLRALFSTTALEDSVRVIRIRQDPFAATITNRGFNPLKDYLPIAARDGYSVLFRQKRDDYARQFLKSGPVARNFERPGASAVIALKRILELARDNHVAVDLVIYPYHAEMLVLFDSAGLWSVFESWKRTLVNVVEEARSSQADAAMTLWDFSGVHPYTEERVPEPGDRKTGMQFYWEGGHFKRNLGDLVLDRILDGRDTDFGVPLSAANLESTLAMERHGLSEYRSTHPESVRAINEALRAQCLQGDLRETRWPACSTFATSMQ